MQTCLSEAYDVILASLCINSNVSPLNSRATKINFSALEKLKASIIASKRASPVPVLSDFHPEKERIRYSKLLNEMDGFEEKCIAVGLFDT